MYEKVSKRLLGWGIAPVLGNNQQLEDEFGAANIITTDEYTEEQFNEAKKDIPTDIPLQEVCKIDTANKEIVIDPTLKLNYEKKLLGEKLINQRAVEIYQEQAKTELINEGILNPDGTAK